MPHEVNQLAEQVDEQIRQQGLTRLIYFTRPLAEEPNILPYRDALVLASDRAGVPLTVVEIGLTQLPPLSE